jgi:ketosteroid isomerase-like protein
MGPNEKFLRDAYARYMRGEMDVAIAAMADNVVIRSPGNPNRIDSAGEWHGLKGVFDYVTALRTNWERQNFEILELITRDDRRFVVRIAVEAENLHTGARVRVEKVDFVTIENGEITSYEETFDTAPLERASRTR